MTASAWIERGVSLAIGVLLGIFVHSRAQVWGLPPPPLPSLPPLPPPAVIQPSIAVQLPGSPSRMINRRLPAIPPQPSDDDLEYDSDESGEGRPTQRRRGPRALGSQPREELKMVLVSW